jgi:predicted DsbA family dithiol-disulfide isomerase
MFKNSGMSVDVDKLMGQLKNTAAKLGLSFGNRTMTYNSRLAQEIGLWAQTKGLGHMFHMKVFKAYFVQGLNIGLKDVLVDLIQSSGLDPARGRQIMDTREFSNAVDSDWELARARGVTAVPTFFFGRARLVGAQPYEALKKLILQSVL